jgi:UDP-N-acetylglucosamine 2-epimerase
MLAGIAAASSTAARRIEPIVLHTGQHDEVALPLYRFFAMPPSITLAPRRRGTSLAHLAASVLEQAAEAIESARPDLLLVQGDTTSALCCAQAAFYARVPVGHVEAGLRTYATDPFPEEKNRDLIGRIAHWHFTPTALASQNLAREHVGGEVHCVGNTIVDAVQFGLRRLDQTSLTQIDPDDRSAAEVAAFLAACRSAQDGRRLMLVTAHRRENWGRPMRDIARAVAQLAQQRDDLAWIWPLHPNPQLRATIGAELDAVAALPRTRMLLTPPLNYPVLLAVLAQTHLILTDSGGIQEEAATLRRPVIVLREATERPELIDAGGGVLAGTDTERIVAAATRLLDDPSAYAAMQVHDNPFGDGHSAERIVALLGL